MHQQAGGGGGTRAETLHAGASVVLLIKPTTIKSRTGLLCGHFDLSQQEKAQSSKTGATAQFY